MKKNTLMRVGALLAVLTLMTSCFVGGTFAKYVTSNKGDDDARVAKWGVGVEVTGNAFAKEYKTENGTDTTKITVKSDTEVVAPGTTGTFAGIAFTGTPEVAVEIERTAEVTLASWTVDGAYYCPIVVTVDGEEISGLDCDDADEFANKIKEAIATTPVQYEAGTNLSEIKTLQNDISWSWAFEGDNAKDTKLGDADTLATIKIEVTGSVTQVN